MATNSSISTTEGSGKNIATYSISESTTKELQRTVLSDSTGVEISVAHDAVDAGFPIKVGLKAESQLSTATMVADGDRTNAYADIDGVQLVRNQFPLGDLLSERIADTTGTSTVFSNFGATPSTRNYITAISVYNSSATAGYLDIRDGSAGSILYTIPLPAGGGAIMSSTLPLFRSTANTALAYDVSTALTTVYISISGFKSKV